jgi:double-strand break repair protein MRE11
VLTDACDLAVKPDQPELSIDDPSFSIQDKLQRVRVGTLVKEYLSVQDLQLLGELGMEDAVHMYVDKDDSAAIKKLVPSLLLC